MDYDQMESKDLNIKDSRALSAHLEATGLKEVLELDEGGSMGSDGESNPLDDPEERKHFYSVLNSFYRYRDQSHYNITHRRRQSLYSMPQSHWQLLASPPFNLLDTLSAVDDAIDRNAEVVEAFLDTGLAFMGLDPLPKSNELPSFVTPDRKVVDKPEWQGSINHIDQEKAHSTLRQLYRDWSIEGASERAACYTPVLSTLSHEFRSIPIPKRSAIKILVPGAGLGRLVFDLVCAGYRAEGNEISYHQVIASNAVLNFTTHAEQYEIYPWIAEFSNHISRNDQLQSVRVPDVHPGTAMGQASEAQGAEVHAFERMSFSSADFCVAYRQPESEGVFDAVATVFFIDTAPNVLRYVETVHHCLREGGIWINLGPLKWHFENNSPPSGDGGGKASESRNDIGIAEPGSVELTDEEVILLIGKMGFQVEKYEALTIETGYIGNPRSMWKGTYRPSFWVARKVSN